jgi:hypothetical protein
MSSPVWTTPLVIGASICLGPLIGRALSRAFPPQEPVPNEYEILRSRYNNLNVAAQLASVAAIISSAYFLFSFVPSNTPWIVGVLFGWLVLAPVLLIALFTLPRGFARWREFWRFYELRYKINLRFLTPLYALLCLLGIISTAVMLQRL